MRIFCVYSAAPVPTCRQRAYGFCFFSRPPDFCRGYQEATTMNTEHAWFLLATHWDSEACILHECGNSVSLHTQRQAPFFTIGMTTPKTQYVQP